MEAYDVIELYDIERSEFEMESRTSFDSISCSMSSSSFSSGVMITDQMSGVH